MLSHEDIIWIGEHALEDTSRLRLRHSGDIGMTHLIMQVESRHKYQKKFNRTLKCEAFEFPTALAGEQATSDRLAEFHSQLINPGERIADMTAGLGIDAIHFAGKACTVTAIEQDTIVAQTLANNAKVMGMTNLTVLNTDCTKWIKHPDNTFDTIFIDPARRGTNGERIFNLRQCSPDITAIFHDIAAVSKKLIIKMSPMLDVTQIARELPGVTEIYAVGTSDECKELVAVINFGSTANTFTCHAVTLMPNGDNLFTFLPNQETTATTDYGITPEAKYLYEPYPSVMKMSPYKLLAQRYGITPLHPNTHIYTSSQKVDDFPGSIMIIDEIMPFSSASLKQLKRRRIEASVSTRNFVMSAAKLSARIQNSESSSHRLFGVTTVDPIQPQQLITAHIPS